MTDINQINYQPLLGNAQATRQERAGLKALDKSKEFFLGLGGTLVAVVLMIVAHSTQLVYLAVLCWLPALRIVGRLSAQYRKNVWATFAAANNWALDDTAAKESLVTPSLQFGHSQVFGPIVKANLGQAVTADLFSYSCVTGEGRSRTEHRFMVARTQLPKTLPHMILKNKKTHIDIHQDLANHEQLQLEGNFGNYFKLQIEKNQEIDALTIITPDVMQTLISYDQAEDVEIFGDGLYFIIGIGVFDIKNSDYKAMQQLIPSVVGLSGRIIEHLKLEGSVRQVQPNPATTAPQAVPQTKQILPQMPINPVVPVVAPVVQPAAQPQPAQNLNNQQPDKL